MSIERVFYCDGPGCEGNVRRSGRSPGPPRRTPRYSPSMADLNQLAAKLVERTVDETERESESPRVEAARKGGAKGGRARAATLTAEQRSEIARRAARARWSS